MWIIARTRGEYAEWYMDLNRIDRAGAWKEYGQGFPLRFDKYSRANNEKKRQIELEPDWEYEVREYNR